MIKLTNKQQMFVKEYLVDLNATQAAIRAGYSLKSAAKIGPQLLGKTRIAEELQSAMNKRAAKIEITADRVLAELAKMAFFNIQDVFNEEGVLISISELPRDTTAAIQSIKVNTTTAGLIPQTVTELKLWDKKGSLELLGKHLRLFVDTPKEDEETPAPTRVEVIVRDARKPVECDKD